MEFYFAIDSLDVDNNQILWSGTDRKHTDIQRSGTEFEFYLKKSRFQEFTESCRL